MPSHLPILLATFLPVFLHGAVRHLPACWRAPLRRAKACPREDVWHAIISLKLGGDEYKCVRGDATSWSAGGAVVAGKTRTAQP
jgi:hypothetical protein